MKDLQNKLKFPSILINILKKSGYDSRIALGCLNEEKVIQVEKFIIKNKESFQEDLAGDPYYSKLQNFQFLPGHKSILINCENLVKKYEECEKNSSEKCKCSKINWSLLPIILRELIKNAISNAEKDKYHHRYPDLIKYFATYIYMLCGKMCYEVLSSNLSLPTSVTIGKLYSFSRTLQEEIVCSD